MSILNDAILSEVEELIQREVRNEVNQIKIEDAKIIVQVLLPEIDKIITSKITPLPNKMSIVYVNRMLAARS